ncbi:MAG: single-stranded DNA-binding protein [Erysipelotrichaceae bacterium]|nr:single-stranded DNA-binding protein [Erysipelotrichaceae bacterium]
MINNVVLIGRITKDLELRKTQSNLSVISFTLAVERNIKKEDGTKDTDFINCVAWRQSADFLYQYANKGDLIGVSGRLTTRNYDGQNGKVYVTEVTCDEVNLLAKVNKENQEKAPRESQEDTSININPEDLPFY